MKLDILNSKSNDLIMTLNDVSIEQTVGSIKRGIHEKNGRFLPDEETLGELQLPAVGAQLYMRDFGWQIGWKTVLLLEYFGPLIIYPFFFCRPSCVYGEEAKDQPMLFMAKLGGLFWMIHFAKRIAETLWVHRFSHATMPIKNLFKNCAYYWGFTAFIAFHLNHPLYISPVVGLLQIISGLIGFLIAEFGTYSVHISLRNLRQPGTSERKIPMPNGNPLTNMFTLVSCPNYTYEALAWLSFGLMTQSLPALIFTAVGLFQMSIWAIEKHKAYKREFPNYPKGRCAILPLVL